MFIYGVTIATLMQAWAALPRGATGLSAVCDCGISWSYSLTIFHVEAFRYITEKKSYLDQKGSFVVNSSMNK